MGVESANANKTVKKGVKKSDVGFWRSGSGEFFADRLWRRVRGVALPNIEKRRCLRTALTVLVGQWPVYLHVMTEQWRVVAATALTERWSSRGPPSVPINVVVTVTLWAREGTRILRCNKVKVRCLRQARQFSNIANHVQVNKIVSKFRTLAISSRPPVDFTS